MIHKYTQFYRPVSSNVQWTIAITIHAVSGIDSACVYRFCDVPERLTSIKQLGVLQGSNLGPFLPVNTLMFFHLYDSLESQMYKDIFYILMEKMHVYSAFY